MQIYQLHHVINVILEVVKKFWFPLLAVIWLLLEEKYHCTAISAVSSIDSYCDAYSVASYDSV